MSPQLLYVLTPVLVISISLFVFWVYRKPDENNQAQRLLDQYMSGSMSPLEIGKLYERYIGHLYEMKGCWVEYHGALNGYSDLGRDLIVKNGRDTYIIQTKCWSKNKLINENHIFQLYGSMEHYHETENHWNNNLTAIFYTTARFSEKAKDVADVLGVKLITLKLDKSYPLIKCNVSVSGEKIYHLPFDPYYDKIKIKAHKGDLFVYTVEEAVAKGFRRARNYKNVA
jgi:hypothetical protein